MLSTQAPTAIPRIHVLYTDLPATSRRAANIPFLAARAAPVSTSCTPMKSTTPHYPPMPTRRTPPPPPRRNAISYHPSQPSCENPFADPATSRQSLDLFSPRQPLPRSRATLISSGPIPMSYSQSLFGPPPRVVRSQRDYPAKIVANMLLNRSGRARPMRGCTRRGSGQAGYVRSGLSVCVLSDAELEAEDGSESDA
ncbi:hypothetical protein BV25DRAFT_1838661 [Artomyces pyxidatus]|uniref:Uncharacterized protein n=1 Tax=Artomyces pyxidatus TaxID=48021 RepID=A0ACB8T278_9AGAM|nr:hypothetical protein BV25DRAFT_1838661 [Artomyces pyxidatus]